MADWQFLGLTLKKVHYLKAIIVWALSSTFVSGGFLHYYHGKHVTLITIAIFMIGWFFAVLWMLLSSNKLPKPIEKPRPKFDNPIAESLYDALKDMSEKSTKDSKQQNLRSEK